MDEQDFTFVLSKNLEEDEIGEYIPKGTVQFDCSYDKTGIALIFNHRRIPGQNIRLGSEYDSERLNKVLTSFGFDVKMYDELHYKEIMDILNTVSLEDHSKTGCLLISVMSHGSAGKIMANDKSYLVEDLWKPFLADKCPSFINKPKLFFIDACRGKGYDKGVEFLRRKQPKILPDNGKYSIPNTADLHVMYSSYGGYVSFITADEGSWFTQGFCDELSRVENNVELYSLLTTVMQKVAKDSVNISDTIHFHQMPSIVSTLTKMFYFHRKNES